MQRMDGIVKLMVLTFSQSIARLEVNVLVNASKMVNSNI